MWETLIGQLSITRVQAMAVVITTVVMYAALLFILRLLGPRVLASLAGFDLAATLAIGALLGRTILGNTPVLAGGLVGLATLVTMQAFVGQIRRTRSGMKIVGHPPVLLMVDGQLLESGLNRTHIVETEMFARLRLLGIRDLQEVALMILETNGAISVIRRGQPISAALLVGVRGAENIPSELIAPPP